MNEENIKNDSGLGGRTLEVFCVDSIGVKDRTTFDARKVDKVQVTFWAEDEQDIEERLKGMFDILFREMIKNRGKKGDI